MSKYYYDPITRKYFKSVYSAVYNYLHEFSYSMEVAVKNHSTAELRLLLNPLWCDDHIEQVCEMIGIYKVKTRWKMEVLLRQWFYRYLLKVCYRTKKE